VEGMNKRLRLAVRNAVCDDCALHTEADGENRCVTGQGPNGARVAVVTKTPLSEGSRMRAELSGYLTEAGIDPRSVMWLSALKCQVWGMEATKTHQKACAPYLRKEFEFLNPEFVLCLGAEAWFAASGWADITKNRGKTFGVNEGDGIIFPTISPSAVARNPGLLGGFMADLRYFARLVNDDTGATTPPHHVPAPDRVHNVVSKQGLRDTVRALRAATVVSYDIETTGSAPWDSDGRIVSLSLTTATDAGMDSAEVWQIPLYHPESPWRRKWRTILRILAKWLCRVPKRVAHNAKFDSKWLVFFDVPMLPTFDTIIALALLDENQPKGLKPTAQQRLGADPWGIDTKDLLNTPLSEVLDYNGLDTWHTLRLYYILRLELAEHQRTLRLFQHLMMPLVQELVLIEINGVYVDRDQLEQNWLEVKSILDRIHTGLREHIPPPEEIPEQFFNRRGELQVNFNRSNFALWWLFEHLELPVLAHTAKGGISMVEDVMASIFEETKHPAVKLMMERVEWNKYDTAFFRPWSEQIDHNSRIHTVFKPWGTRTGRLSSGKEDAEKITAGARNQKGVNLQQVPRNKLARGVFGAPPGSRFVEADYSQIELRLAAFIANERRMLHLYATGQDIHMATAMQMTGKPASRVTPEERKKAKAVNFGFLYGMGPAKFIETAWSNYGVRVTEQEAQAFREAFFAGFPDLLPWHGRQRRLVRKYGRVETPMGRIRHLPDIYSPDKGVQAEAERQAINSPVQAIASDMAALALVHISRDFRSQGLNGFAVGPVHDAINFEIPEGELPVALPLIKHHMENLPLKQLFGFDLTVPVIADVKTGSHWGGAIEVPAEVVTDETALRMWLRKNPAKV
jgi:uracil-DNA glycosylase family 4